jgi:hypothetical protein
MEEDREVIRLATVLREIARSSRDSALADEAGEGQAFCAQQYNRILARLGEIDPATAQLFPPLPETAPPRLVRAVSKELAALIAGDRRGHHHHEHRHHEHRRTRRIRALGLGYGWAPENGK